MNLQSPSPVPEPVDHSLLNRQELLYSTLNDLSKWLFFTRFFALSPFWIKLLKQQTLRKLNEATCILSQHQLRNLGTQVLFRPNITFLFKVSSKAKAQQLGSWQRTFMLCKRPYFNKVLYRFFPRLFIVLWLKTATILAIYKSEYTAGAIW